MLKPEDFYQALRDVESPPVESLAGKALADGHPAADVLNQGLIGGMAIIGKDFKARDLWVLQCAEYVASRREDESLQLVGSEQGGDKVALAERDIVYLNKGSNSGVKAGDLYTLHHVVYPLKHPVTGKKLGSKVETTGWVKVILFQEDTACAVIEQSCTDIHAGNYLKPFEKVNVPMVVQPPPAECCAPANGKITRHVVDMQEAASIAGTGQFLTIDAGAEDGVAPGNVFSVFRSTSPSVPTPCDAVGEVTVVAVREQTATAKLTYSRKEVMLGDQVELR